jgi:hypothetical protein
LIPEAVGAILERLRKAVDEAGLPCAARLRVVAAARELIVTRGKPGKRKDARLDRASVDYEAGMRGLKLFRKHIPGYDKLSHWRRGLQQRRLMGALQQRVSRSKKKRHRRNPPTGALLRRSQPT